MPKQFSPEFIFMKAFEYFDRDTLDLSSLLRIAFMAGFPSPSVAQDVLLGLVQMGLLSCKKEGDQVLYSLVPPSDDPKQ